MPDWFLPALIALTFLAVGAEIRSERKARDREEAQVDAVRRGIERGQL